MKKVRKWKWTPFSNPARSDGVQFCHWQRTTDEPKEYPFAKLNRQLTIPEYTINEYNTHLRMNTKWNKAQTDHLFELAQRFDTRFVIVNGIYTEISLLLIINMKHDRSLGPRQVRHKDS